MTDPRLFYGLWEKGDAGMDLDEAAVSRLLRMEEVIPAMERALADFSSGKVVQPVRVMVPVAEHQDFLGLMPAHTGRPSASSSSPSIRRTKVSPPTTLRSSCSSPRPASSSSAWTGV